MTAYCVAYVSKDDGFQAHSQIVYRYDSLSELSAKTIAKRLLAEGHREAVIVKLEMRPVTRVSNLREDGSVDMEAL